MKDFKNYNKEELLNTIDKISIEKIENCVVTKFDNRVINTSNVSNRYEIFDIVKYIKDKIELIEKNFTITKYKFKLTRGQQSLTLLSDSIEIGGVDFHKSFYILNSTDKSRRLSFNAGLKSDKFYSIGMNNAGMNKKHLTGVTKSAEQASIGLDSETFDQQIQSLKSLVGHRIHFSKIQQIILGDKEEIPQINHHKFDAFKNSYASYDNKIRRTNEQPNLYLDAFLSFQIYLRLFNKQDAHIIKNETERIMKLTQWAVRNSILESLGI
jgi:hypothetical protein